MIIFLIKSSICLAALLLAYLWFLENEKINQFKRLILWVCILFSFTIPFVNFNFATNSILYQTGQLSLPTIEITKYSEQTPFSKTSIFWLIYVVGVSIMSYRFSKNLYNIYRKIKINKHQKHIYATIILVPAPCLPHTFLNYIFLNEQDFFCKKIPTEILLHEQTHAKQLHSIDIIAIETLKIIFWFNPIFHAYKKAMQRNHEFLADEKVVTETNNISTYQTQLLVYSKPIQNYILTSNINYSLTKKRFIMMTKTVSNQAIFIKKAVLMLTFSCLTLLLCEKTAAQSTATASQNNEIYSSVDVKPEFPGGITAFYKYFMDSMQIPKNLKAKGKLIMLFVVEKDGSLSDITVVKDENTKLGDEATAVLQKSPKWIPGKQGGKIVRVQYTLPISIVLGD